MDKTLERILELIPKKETGKFKQGSLKKFANSIGLKSGNLISDWIAGRSQSYNRYVHQIAAQYGVSVEWLCGKTDEKYPKTLSLDVSQQGKEKPAIGNDGGLSEEEIQIIQMYRKLPSAYRSGIIAQLQVFAKQLEEDQQP